MSNQSFRELGVSAPVAAALAAQSIEHPFPIQASTLPASAPGSMATRNGESRRAASARMRAWSSRPKRVSSRPRKMFSDTVSSGTSESSW